MKYIIIIAFTSISLISLASSKKGEKLIAKNAKVEKAGDGFIFTEGPAVAPDGRVYFTDQPNDRIHIWDENDTLQAVWQRWELLLSRRFSGAFPPQKDRELELLTAALVCRDVKDFLITLRSELFLQSFLNT